MKIKIISWNIWGGRYLDKIIDFLRDQNADIIALQEVIQDPDGTNNTAEIIAKELGYKFVYGNTMEFNSTTLIPNKEKYIGWGNAILSKFDIIEHRVHELSAQEMRTALEATIEMKTILRKVKSIKVFSTHLLHTHLQQTLPLEERVEEPSHIRDEQAVNLVNLVPATSAVVMGDFNSNPKSETIRIMNGSLKPADPRPTIPTWSMYPEGCSAECNPLKDQCRLDYIFTTPDVEVISCKVEKSDGSDHVPVSAVIKI